MTKKWNKYTENWEDENGRPYTYRVTYPTVYSDVVGQAFYFRPDNCRMVLGQLPRAFRTHLDVPESPWNPGVWGWKTPKKVDWHFVRFRCGICPLMNRALSIFRAALRCLKG